MEPGRENTERRERALLGSQMDAKSVLTSNKPGQAPAADAGSSGPRGTGKAEPGSGKARALGRAASCPAALLPPLPWALPAAKCHRPSPGPPLPTRRHKPSPSLGTSPTSTPAGSRAGWRRGWRKPPGVARAFLGRGACTRRACRDTAPHHDDSGHSQLSCQAWPPSLWMSLLRLHHARKQSGGRQEKAGILQAKASRVAGSCGACSGESPGLPLLPCHGQEMKTKAETAHPPCSTVQRRAGAAQQDGTRSWSV